MVRFEAPDFGEPIYEEGLRILLDDYANLSELTPEGNYLQRTFLRGGLVGRLLTVNALQRFPDHADVKIERPIFVTGLPRSGTTALTRLLCADTGAQGLELWLTEYPPPRPPRECPPAAPTPKPAPHRARSQAAPANFPKPHLKQMMVTITGSTM